MTDAAAAAAAAAASMDGTQGRGSFGLGRCANFVCFISCLAFQRQELRSATQVGRSVRILTVSLG
jgi:hypothetical protein